MRIEFIESLDLDPAIRVLIPLEKTTKSASICSTSSYTKFVNLRDTTSCIPSTKHLLQGQDLAAKRPPCRAMIGKFKVQKREKTYQKTAQNRT